MINREETKSDISSAGIWFFSFRLSSSQESELDYQSLLLVAIAKYFRFQKISVSLSFIMQLKAESQNANSHALIEQLIILGSGK